MEGRGGRVTEAHVCDECKGVAPMNDALLWWSVETIESYRLMGEKTAYDFCSWSCMAAYAQRMAFALEPQPAP